MILLIIFWGIIGWCVFVCCACALIEAHQTASRERAIEKTLRKQRRIRRPTNHNWED